VTFDPAATEPLRTALEAHLASQGGALRVPRAPERIGNGLDTYIYSFNAEGAGPPDSWASPLILRVYPAVSQSEKARREFAVQQFAIDRGFPAPRPLLLDDAGAALGLPFMIMERVPGVPLLDRMKNPLALSGVIRAMADLHVRLHQLPVEGCPLPSSPPLVNRQLADIERDLQKFGIDHLSAEYRWLQTNGFVVEDEEPVLLHNDFHPLNIMIDTDGRMTLLDWSDAALGDRHHDLARTLALFWLAPPLAPTPLERTLLRVLRRYIVPAYIRRYAASLPVDPVRLRYWQALHAFRAWIQVLALQRDPASLDAREGAAGLTPPGFEDSLAAYFRERASQSLVS
jgi:aminoglycoside phosphotransferase (APT) family kinase protein